MGPRYQLTALKTGTLTVWKASMTYMAGFGEQIHIPVWSVAVEGNGVRALIDTGIRHHDRWDRELCPCWREEDESVEAALAEIGWRPRDIDLVILSHLHYDHAENNTVFTSARFAVSRAEWEYAKHPIPSQAQLYDFEWTSPEVTEMDYSLIAADDYDLLPGLRIIQTPGHTKGHQSVLVSTDQGVVCVAGDAACLPESFSTPSPPGGATSIEEGFASLERIRSSAQRVIMAHDPNISKFQSGGFPEIPAVGSDPLPGTTTTLPRRPTGTPDPSGG